MTVETQTKSVTVSGNGSATAFSFSPMVIFATDELLVTHVVRATGVETAKTLTDDYTVTVSSFPGTGTITYPVSGDALASGESLVIKRVLTLEQTVDLENQGGYFPDTQETALDKTAMVDLQQQEEIDRSIKIPITNPAWDTSVTNVELPIPVGGSYIRWNLAATAFENTSSAATQYLGSNGSAAAPFYSFTSDVNSGFYRIGADNIGLSLGGTKRIDYGTAGMSVTGTITGSGILSIDDTTESSSTTTGSIHTDGGLGVAKKLYVGGVATHGGDILSDTDSTDSLGSTGVRWAALWADAFTITNNGLVSGNLTVTGNLTINGTTITHNADNLILEDPLILLNNALVSAGTNTYDMGLYMARGDADNAFMGYDESENVFTVGTTTTVHTTQGALSLTAAPMVAATFEPSGDTSASDTAAIGYTSVEGLIMTGQGSSYDFVLKNDADGDVARVATGTTVLDLPGSLKLATGATVTGIEDSDTLSSDSATLLATQQSIKAYIDSSSKAAGISMTWETATDDSDQGVGKVWASASSFTPGSDYTLYFDDVERNSVSINALIDSLDDPTATNSATIYIQEAGTATAGLVFLVNGNVTSASTYSRVAVEHVATFGTLTDGDVVGVTISFSGNNGAGDLSAANNLSDVASASTSLTNIGGVNEATAVVLAIALG